MEQLQAAHKKCSTSSPSSSTKITQTVQAPKGGRTSVNANTTQANASSPWRKKPTAVGTSGKGLDDSGVLGSLVLGRSGTSASPWHSPGHAAGDPAEDKWGEKCDGGKGGGKRRRDDREEDGRKKATLTIPKGSASGNHDVSAPGTPTHGYANISQIMSEDIKNSKSHLTGIE